MDDPEYNLSVKLSADAFAALKDFTREFEDANHRRVQQAVVDALLQATRGDTRILRRTKEFFAARAGRSAKKSSASQPRPHSRQ
jgi:hypothetical protein